MMNNIHQEEFELFNHVTNLFKQGITKNSIKDLPLSFLIAFAFVPIITLVKFNSEGRITMNDDLINQAIEIAWNTVKA